MAEVAAAGRQGHDQQQNRRQDPSSLFFSWNTSSSGSEYCPDCSIGPVQVEREEAEARAAVIARLSRPHELDVEGLPLHCLEVGALQPVRCRIVLQGVGRAGVVDVAQLDKQGDPAVLAARFRTEDPDRPWVVVGSRQASVLLDVAQFEDVPAVRPDPFSLEALEIGLRRCRLPGVCSPGRCRADNVPREPRHEQESSKQSCNERCGHTPNPVECVHHSSVPFRDQRMYRRTSRITLRDDQGPLQRLHDEAHGLPVFQQLRHDVQVLPDVEEELPVSLRTGSEAPVRRRTCSRSGAWGIRPGRRPAHRTPCTSAAGPFPW